MVNVKFDYKDTATLQQYLDSRGRIKSRHETKLTPQQQKQLAAAVKRARHLALLP